MRRRHAPLAARPTGVRALTGALSVALAAGATAVALVTVDVPSASALSPGQTATFGFVGNWNAANNPPTVSRARTP